MKIHFQKRNKRALALGATLGGLLTAVNLGWAQPLQPEVLFRFDGTNGKAVFGELTFGKDGSFYGTTSGGGDLSLNGSFGDGTVFRLTTNGVLTTLVSFNGTNGSRPYAGLTLGSDGNFYGTSSGEDTGYGYIGATVFKVMTNGVLTTLVSFGYSDYSYAGLTLGSDGNFYGIAGNPFRVTTNGILTTLGWFDGTNDSLNGTSPCGGVTQAGDGSFYGTTFMGGTFDAGTVFKMTTNGVFTSLVSFAYTNGANPFARLTIGADGNFYGTTEFSGALFTGSGTVFRVTTNGVLTTLVSFNFANGAVPEGGLTLGSDGNLYGTTSQGGDHGDGTVFQMTTNGIFTTLVSFDYLTNGSMPSAALTLGSDGNFYGTTYDGVFRLRHGASIQLFGMTTNGFQINTLNVGGSGWVVLESSSDLMTWTPIQTNGTAAAQTFLDPAALTQPQQFYRVRQL